MKKSYKLFVILLSVLLITVYLPGCGGGANNGGGDNSVVDNSSSNSDGGNSSGNGGGSIQIPDEIQQLMDTSVSLATECAKQLDGEWGDMHADMIASGDKDGYAGFDDMRAKLSDMITSSGADYIYALYPTDPSDVEANFYITVDGSAEPDDYGVEYEAELGMVLSWQSGIPKTSSYGWGDDNGYHWSAYAPIHNSAGDVVAVLGLDYPAPIIADMPEWDVDSDSWNHFEWQ